MFEKLGRPETNSTWQSCLDEDTGDQICENCYIKQRKNNLAEKQTRLSNLDAPPGGSRSLSWFTRRLFVTWNYQGCGKHIFRNSWIRCSNRSCNFQMYIGFARGVHQLNIVDLFISCQLARSICRFSPRPLSPGKWSKHNQVLGAQQGPIG